MAVKKILMLSKHEKTLRSKSEPVPKVNRELKALFKDLRDTMEDAGNAIGLAAPQIGVMKRVFAVRLGYKDAEQAENAIMSEGAEGEALEKGETPEQDSDTPREMPPAVIMVNPQIVERSAEVERASDGCLSIPGLMGYTNRSFRIHVKYLDEQGQPQDQWFEKWDARMIQHEQDHLDGILFMDRLTSFDDLFVVSRDDEGKLIQTPYKDVVNNAKQRASGERRKPIFAR